MSITSSWNSLDANSFRIKKEITDSNFEYMMQNLVALYEAAAHTSAPNAPTQTYAGHDHGYEGGSPITRGALGVCDGHSAYIYKHSPSGTPPYFWSETITRSPKNPGGEKTHKGKLGVWFRYKAGTQNFYISINDGDEKLLKSFDETQAPRWEYIEGGGNTGNYQYEFIKIKTRPEKEKAEGDLYLYNIIISEIPGLTYPSKGLFLINKEILEGATTVYSYFDTMETDLVGNGEWVDASLLLRINSAINSITEYTTNLNAPGANSQRIKGHDHAGYGGRAVPMGAIYSSGSAEATIKSPLWQLTLSSNNTWYFIDQSSSIRRSDGTAGGTSTIPIFYAYISPGFSSSGSPPTSNPAIGGCIYVDITSGYTYEIRLRNLTTSTYSETITITTPGFITFSYVPCSGGSFNKYSVEVRVTDLPSGGSASFDTLGIWLYEQDQMAVEGSYITRDTSTKTVLSSVNDRIKKQ